MRSDHGLFLQSVAERLTILVQADPCLMLGILYVMPADAWGSIVDQSAFRELMQKLAKKAEIALDARGISASAHAADVGQNVLLKLTEGKFLKRYQPDRKHPRPYLLGCAKFIALAEARSVARRQRREGVELRKEH